MYQDVTDSQQLPRPGPQDYRIRISADGLEICRLAHSCAYQVGAGRLGSISYASWLRLHLNSGLELFFG